MGNVSKTVIRDARKHLKSDMIERATIERTGITVPCLVVVQRWAILLHGVMADHLRQRKWMILMPPSALGSHPDPVWKGTTVHEGDRVTVPGHGTFLIAELTDPDTYNVATNVWGVLSNASVTFSRGQATVGPTHAYMQRVTDEEKSWGVRFDWEVWFDSSIRYPDGTPGGILVSKGDNMNWPRSPNPFPMGGNAVLDQPRYVYGANGDPVVTAYFKEPV